MTNTVVFLIYHGMGHFNACFRLAKSLSSDHDVVFAGHSSFKSYIETQGFIFYPLSTVPFGMGFEQWINEQEKNKYPNLKTIQDRWSDRIYKLREAELNQLLKDLEPDTILIDSYQSTDFVVLYPSIKNTSTRVAFVQTMLPTIIRDSLPPINSLILPDSDEIKKAWKRFRWKSIKKNVKETLRYLGMNDDAIIQRRIRKNKIPRSLLAKEKNLRGASFTNIYEFILAPPEFDFPQHITNSFQKYIGFQPDLKRIEVSDMEYFKLDAEIRRKVKENESILIYCSFGSVRAGDTSAVNAFIKKLFQAVHDRNCIVILSINSIQHENTFSEVPENVYVLKAAPQIEILARADLFITHGGLNSIKEAVYMGVPMLVYPLHDITDTAGNSSRVVYHQLGLRGDLLNDTVENINKKIVELINNDVYKKNIFTLREKDEEYTLLFRKFYDELTPLH
jgi:zeaxanthin glucosyltransferase